MPWHMLLADKLRLLLLRRPLATHRELHEQMQAFAAGLHTLGLRQGDRVSLFSENSSRWLIADQVQSMSIDAGAKDCMLLRHGSSCVSICQSSGIKQLQTWQSSKLTTPAGPRRSITI